MRRRRPSGWRSFTASRTRTSPRSRRSAAWACCSARSGWPRCCCATCSSGAASWRCSARSATAAAHSSRSSWRRTSCCSCWGLAVGALCALVAIAPAVLERGGRLPIGAGGWLLLLACSWPGCVSSIVGDARGAPRAAARGASGGVADACRSRCNRDARARLSRLAVVAASSWRSAPRPRRRPRTGRSGAGRRSTASAPRRTCRSAGRRPRTSPGSWRCPPGPARRRSSGAIASSSTSADGREMHLWAVDRDTRRRALEAAARRRQHAQRKQNMSSPSPVTDGRHVWVMTGTGILKAFDFDGNEIWARDIQKDYGRFGLNWGYGSSPLLHEDSLYVQVLHGMQHRRSVLRAAHRQGDRQDALARRAADPRAIRVARRLHDAGAAALRRHAPRSSSPAATSSPATIRPPARSCGAPTASTPTTTATTASSPRRSCTAT